MKKLLFLALLFLPQLVFAGSQTYSTAGTYSFTVPAYGTLTVTVSGGGGGGGGLDWAANGYPINAFALDGESSSFGSYLIAYGGGRGHGCYYTASNTGFPGADGTASGGDTNTTGGGGAGGYGTWATPQNYNCATGSPTTHMLSAYRSANSSNPPQMNSSVRNLYSYYDLQVYGGAGGAATKTYQAGALTQGASIPVVVGRGGAGETVSTAGSMCPGWGCYSGYDGEPGTVTITWTDPLAQCDGTPYTYSTPGTYARVIPSYGTMAVEMWGAGGGGADAVGNNGVAGGDTSFASLTAGGGGGGPSSPCPTGYCPVGPVGEGGIASGGDINTNGTAGPFATGADAPNGGSGGSFGTWYGSAGGSGGFPAAGGGSGHYPYGDGWGGGSGAYVKKTYASGAFTVGSPLSIVVGAGGAGGGGSYNGGSGASGQIKITCTPGGIPNPPGISGSTSGSINTSYAYAFIATDPNGDTVRYAIDWDNDGTVDEYAPTIGYVASGATASTTHSWSTTGSKTFQARTQDVNGNTSGWTTYAVAVSNPAPTVLLTASPSSITSSQSSTLTWSSAYATSCTGTNFTTGGAVSGTLSVSPTVTTSYTLSCSGLGGTASTSKTVTYTCTPSNICSGNNVVNSCTGVVITACSYQCGAGACIAPPASSFIPGSATTGHLQLKPSIVRSGAATIAYWNVSNVSLCAVTSTNGDSWTGASSLSSGKISNAITQQTTFTLACTGLDGSHINETQVVNIIPTFQEQ